MSLIFCYLLIIAAVYLLQYLISLYDFCSQLKREAEPSNAKGCQEVLWIPALLSSQLPFQGVNTLGQRRALVIFMQLLSKLWSWWQFSSHGISMSYALSLFSWVVWDKFFGGGFKGLAHVYRVVMVGVEDVGMWLSVSLCFSFSICKLVYRHFPPFLPFLVLCIKQSVPCARLCLLCICTKLSWGMLFQLVLPGYKWKSKKRPWCGLGYKHQLWGSKSSIFIFKQFQFNKKCSTQHNNSMVKVCGLDSA